MLFCDELPLLFLREASITPAVAAVPITAIPVIAILVAAAVAADAVTVIDGVATPAITVNATDDGVVSKDGENFYVLKGDDFAAQTFTKTFAVNESIDAAGTNYIGIRFKIDDETAPYYYQNSRFQVSVKINGTEYRIDDWVNDSSASQQTSANWFVDYNWTHIGWDTGLPVGTLRIPAFLLHNESL